MKQTLKKYSILVIDDDTTLVQVLNDKLKREGFSVFEAFDGVQGLAQSLKHRPDLILLDILMPVMDGLTMMNKLREENEWGKKVPIIILSNLSPDEEKMMHTINTALPAYYLVKSNWSLDEVVNKIRDTLESIR